MNQETAGGGGGGGRRGQRSARNYGGREFSNVLADMKQRQKKVGLSYSHVY